MKILLIIILSLIGGWMYRCGGLSKEDANKKVLFKWVPSFLVQTKTRDWGVPLISTIILSILFSLPWWVLVVHFILLFISLTTYFSELVKPKDDVAGIEWIMTGLCYGLSLIPIVFYNPEFLRLFIIRSVVLSFLTMAWSVIFENADIEEFGRGTLIGLSFLFLHIR